MDVATTAVILAQVAVDGESPELAGVARSVLEHFVRASHPPTRMLDAALVRRGRDATSLGRAQPSRAGRLPDPRMRPACGVTGRQEIQPAHVEVLSARR